MKMYQREVNLAFSSRKLYLMLFLVQKL